MKYAVIGVASLLSLEFLTYVFFLAVMHLRDMRDAGRLPENANWINSSVKYVGYALDFLFNIAASIEFLELPREYLFTDRVNRHIAEDGYRGNRARWYCRTFLNPADPGHCR